VDKPELITIGGDQLQVNFGGKPLKGYAQKGVVIEPAAPRFGTKRALGGQVIPVMSRDNRAKATLTLLRGSESNSLLDMLAKADQFTGKAALPFIAHDKVSGGFYFSLQSRITKVPGFQSGESELVWEFELYYLISKVGYIPTLI